MISLIQAGRLIIFSESQAQKQTIGKEKKRKKNKIATIEL